MSTLIAYASRYGTTEECARYLATRLAGETHLLDIRRPKGDEMKGCSSIVVAGPIYGGKIMGVVERFCETHKEQLLRSTVGLYICCLYDGEQAQAQLTTAFPPWLNAHARIRRAVGGAINVRQLRLFDRFLFGDVAEGDIRTVNKDALDAVAEAMNR